MTMEIFPGPNLLTGNAVTGILTGFGISGNNSTGVVTLTVGLTTNTSTALGADVLLNNVTTYFDGPSVAQGTTGTWFVSGTVSLVDSAGAASMAAKLWDGTTIICTGFVTTPTNNFVGSVALSGFISAPVGNLRISCRDSTAATGKILFNASGNSKDSNIMAIRIA